MSTVKEMAAEFSAGFEQACKEWAGGSTFEQIRARYENDDGPFATGAHTAVDELSGRRMHAESVCRFIGADYAALHALTKDLP